PHGSEFLGVGHVGYVVVDLPYILESRASPRQAFLEVFERIPRLAAEIGRHLHVCIGASLPRNENHGSRRRLHNVRVAGWLLAVGIEKLFGGLLRRPGDRMKDQPRREPCCDAPNCRSCHDSENTMTGNAIEYSNRMRSLIVFVSLLLICSGCSRKRAEDTPLTAADSLKSMRLSEDFHVELFASEPQVMSPVEMVFDDAGRIYVAEMMDYPDDPPAGKPARSRIRLLEDTDGDGKPDRVTVFADNVLAVSGIMPWKGGLIVTSAPDILYMKDDNGDGVADTRKVLYTGFPRVNQEARITNPRFAVDNWIYCANSGSDG